MMYNDDVKTRKRDKDIGKWLLAQYRFSQSEILIW